MIKKILPLIILILALSFGNSLKAQIIKGEVIVDGVIYILDSEEIQPDINFNTTISNLGLGIFIVPLLFLGAIALGMLIENIYIGTLVLIILAGISLTLRYLANSTARG